MELRLFKCKLAVTGAHCLSQLLGSHALQSAKKSAEGSPASRSTSCLRRAARSSGGLTADIAGVPCDQLQHRGCLRADRTGLVCGNRILQAPAHARLQLRRPHAAAASRIEQRRQRLQRRSTHLQDLVSSLGPARLCTHTCLEIRIARHI